MSHHHHHLNSDPKSTPDLITELINLLLPPSAPPSALKYALRILISRITPPSISIDTFSLSESVKRSLVNQGKSSDALNFADLFTKFYNITGPGSVKNKWAVIYLLKSISHDHHTYASANTSASATRYNNSNITNSNNVTVTATSTVTGKSKNSHDAFFASVSDGGLPRVGNDAYPEKGNVGIEGGGVLRVENVKESVRNEYVDIVKEDNEVLERVIVRDVLYACQGIDGRYVKYDKVRDGYLLGEGVKVKGATRVMVRKLCELGWLFRKVRGYIMESMEGFPRKEVGTIGQAFCSALHDELSEYYKLLAILEGQTMNGVPMVNEKVGSGVNYLSLRRLSVWLTEPMVKMRLMAVLVDSCKVLRGGEMASAIHMHAQHGDPLVQEFMGRLLRRVCSPLFEMVRSWVLEGELNDIFAEFFVLGQPKAESLWREGYQLRDEMLPSFISQCLAQRILRTGKSINFLRVCCEDQGWSNAALEAAGTMTRRGGLKYGQTGALEALVVDAAKRIDKHLIDVMYDRYKFKDHCLAIKRYLLLGQGDFVQYLMDNVGQVLSEPASDASLPFKLAGFLESAIRSSNAQYDDPDMLDRLRVKMMPHSAGDRGWDVFSLDYDTSVPLNTVFTELVMARYLRIFNFLWKLRRVEHALIGAWKTMKPNRIKLHLLTKPEGLVKLQFISTMRRCQVLWNEMNHFVTNLQYYIMFEVLEVSWVDFLGEREAAKDLDDLLAAHEKYLHSIVEKSLLGERSQTLNKVLFALFDVILNFRIHADHLYEAVHEWQRAMQPSLSSRSKTKSDAWVGRKALTQAAGELLQIMGDVLTKITKDYSSLLEGFIAQLPMQQYVDLKFLLFRLDFTEFYSRLRLDK